MRYWLSRMTIPAFAVVCAMMGCTKAKPDDQGEAAKQAAANTLFAKQAAPEDFVPPKAKEPVVKPDLVLQEAPKKDWDDLLLRPFKPTEAAIDDIEVKEQKVVELPLVTTPEPKKEKDAKVPAKDKKDPVLDPKKEGTPQEPTEYLGKDFKHWLKQTKNDDPTLREEAIKAVLMFGPNKSMEALPDILLQLERHKKIDVDLAVRVNGIMAVSTIFRNAKAPPDPKLLDRALAVYKLFLKDDQVVMKVRTLQGLPYLGPKSVDLIDDVIKLVNYPGTWEVRKEAIQTMMMMAPEAKGTSQAKILPTLRNHMDWAAQPPSGERSYLVRLTAFQGIAMLAQNSVPPELYNKALYDPEDKVKLTGLNLIATVAGILDSKKLLKEADKEKITKNLDEFIVAVERSKDKDRILRIWAYATIMTVNKSISKARLGPVVEFLNDPDPAVRLQALTVIGLGGEKAKPIAYSYVLAMIHDQNVTLAAAAMNTLVNMEAAEAIEELKKFAEEKKSDTVRHDTALVAAENLEHIIQMRNEKKEKDKKTPDKK